MMPDFKTTSLDDRSPLAWPVGETNFVYGHTADGEPVKQLAGAAGKGTDAKLVAGNGAVFLAVVRLTQAQYDALAIKDPNILYIIPGA